MIAFILAGFDWSIVLYIAHDELHLAKLNQSKKILHAVLHTEGF